MSVTRLRTVKLLSEITDDYFYLEDLIEKLGMNQATESKALKDAREQVRILSTSVNLPSCYFVTKISTRLKKPLDSSRIAPNFGCSTPQDRKRMCSNRAFHTDGFTQPVLHIISVVYSLIVHKPGRYIILYV